MNSPPLRGRSALLAQSEARAREAIRNASRGQKVAERICRRLKHVGTGGYICTFLGINRPIKIVTRNHAIAVLPDGTIAALECPT